MIARRFADKSASADREASTGEADILNRHLHRVRQDRAFNRFDLICQGIVTLVVVLRLWKGWDVALHALGVLALVLLYFTPAMIALRRRHPRRWLLTAANATLGWTVLAWAFCLWSALASPKPARSVQ